MGNIARMRVFAVVCMMALSATAASAADGRPYVGISAGVFMPTDSNVSDFSGSGNLEYDTGYSISGTGGFAFNNGLRLEGELTYKQADTDKVTVFGFSGPVNSDIAALGFLANIYYDFKNSSPVTPYIGGGIGFATLYLSQGTDNTGGWFWSEDDDTVFAYQLAAGVAFDVSKNVAIDLGYRYFGTSDPQFGQLDAEFGSHNLLVGARFKF
jgi:outer membrane immunogenic protein